MTTRSGSFLALGLAAFVAVGCGSSNSSNTTSNGGSTTATTATPKPASPASAGATTHLSNEADEEGGLYFKKRALKAKAGQVTLTMENPKTTGKHHGIAIEGNGVDKDGKIVAPGGKSSITLTLKPGKYSFYCPVPGHEQAGMKGTLVVQ